MEAPPHRDRNGAVILARAIIVALPAIAVVGVARATRDALLHDCGGGGSVWVWAWLISPMSGVLAAVLFAATGRPRSKLRQIGLAFFGAAAGVLLAVVTSYVTLINVGCQDHSRTNFLGASYPVIGMGLGSGLLFVLLLLVGTVLVLVSHANEEHQLDVEG